jgi:hypothetical protein
MDGVCVFCAIPYEDPGSGSSALARSFSYEAHVEDPGKRDDPESFQTTVKTRGIRMPVPGQKGVFIEVGSECKDDEPWPPPYVKVMPFKVVEAEWHNFVRTVERALLEYEVRYPAIGQVDGEPKPKKRRKSAVSQEKART